MTSLMLEPPPTARAPVATVAHVANWFTRPPWHHMFEPPSHGSDEGDHMAGNPNYEFGHGAELLALQKRLGMTDQQMAALLRVRHDTYNRWVSNRENMHKDVFARILGFRTAHDEQITQLINQLDPTNPTITISRNPDAGTTNQLAILAAVREPSIKIVMDTGADATMLHTRLQLGCSVSVMADLLKVRKTTYQRWEAGKDPIADEVLDLVREWKADQEDLIDQFVDLAADTHELTYYRPGDDFPDVDIDIDDWNQAAFLATVVDPSITLRYQHHDDDTRYAANRTPKYRGGGGPRRGR